MTDFDSNNTQNLGNKTKSKKTIQKQIDTEGFVSAFAQSYNNEMSTNKALSDSVDLRYQDPSEVQSAVQQYQYLKTQFKSLLEKYNTSQATLMGKTTGYVNSKPALGTNVFVSDIANNGMSSTYIGAYNDTGASAMNFLHGGEPIYDAKSCQESALYLGAKYYGLQSGNRTTETAKCAVSNDLSTAQKYGVAKIGCSQDPKDMYQYGGTNLDAVYKTPITASQYIGTYNDTWDRRIPLLNNGSQTFSFDDCKKQAQDKNYKYFALQNMYNLNGGQCGLTNDLAKATSFGESKSINVLSDGRKYGGGWGNAIYENKSYVYVPPTAAKAKYIGNFDVDLADWQSIKAERMSYDQCLDLAVKNKAKYFNLQNGFSTKTAQCGFFNKTNMIDPSTGALNQSRINKNVNILDDGHEYGGVWAEAIHEINYDVVNNPPPPPPAPQVLAENNTPSYIGCFKDDPTSRAMQNSKASSALQNDLKPVYVVADTSNSDAYILWLWKWAKGFPDRTAKWIWYIPNSAAYGRGVEHNGERPGPVVFQYTYNSPRTSVVATKIYVAVDDYATIYINGNKIVNDEQDYAEAGKVFIYSAMLTPGENLIQAVCVNAWGQAGFALTCMDSNGNVLFNTNDSWKYSFNSNIKPITIDSNYSVASCQKVAQDGGFAYFGLQGGANGTSQCWVTNDINKAKKYGEASATIKFSDGNNYGTDWVNAIYKVNNPGFLQNVGRAGYIDPQTKVVTPYPDFMISKGETYTLLKNRNYDGSNIQSNPIRGSSVEQCKEACNNDDNCDGFVFDNSSKNCYPKSAIRDYTNTYPNKNTDIYYRGPKIVNNASCNSEFSSIDSIEWQNMQKSNSLMTPETKCNLAKLIDPNVMDVTQLGTLLEMLSAQIIEQILILKKYNVDVISQMGLDQHLLDENLNEYMLLNQKFEHYKKYEIKHINNVLSDTDTVVLQENYGYIFWSILAITVIIITIHFIKKK